MAVKTPILSAPDASVAVQPNTVEKSDSPEALAGIGNLVLQANKQKKLKEARAQFEVQRAAFQDFVPGVEDFELSEQSINVLGGYAKTQQAIKNARGTGQLSESQAHTRSEIELRRMVAKAPGLQDEFIQIASELGLRPTGAGFREAAGVYAQQQTADKDALKDQKAARKAYEGLLIDAGRSDLAGKSIVNGMSLEELYVAGQPFIEQKSKGDRAKLMLSQAEANNELDGEKNYAFISDMYQSNAQTYSTDVLKLVSGKTRQEYAQVQKGQATKFSDEAVREITAAQEQLQQQTASSVQRFRLNPDRKAVAVAPYEASVQAFNAILSGKGTEAANTAIAKNNEIFTMAKVLQDPESAATMTTLSSVSEYNLPDQALVQRGSLAVHKIYEAAVGEGSLSAIQRDDKKQNLPTAMSSEKLYHDMLGALGDKVTVIPSDLDAPASNYIREVSQAVVDSPTADIAVQALENLSAAAYVDLKNRLPDKESVEVAYKQTMSEIGGNMLSAALEPVRQDLLDGKLQLEIVGGTLQVTGTNEKSVPTSRRRGTQNKATVKANLIRKFDRLATANAKFLDVPKEEFMKEALVEYTINNTQLRERAEALTQKLESSQGTDRSARSRRTSATKELKDLQQQIQRIQDLVKDDTLTEDKKETE